MALQFVLGGSGSGKSEYVQNIAIKLAMEDRSNNILMIVPDQFTMQTQWQMANRHPDGGIINIDVLSFSRLPRRLFEEVGTPKRTVLDDTGKCLLIKKGALKVKDRLHVLSRGMDNAGWSAEVKSVISEFMQYGIAPSDIDTIMSKVSENVALSLKLTDLKLLYEAFLTECSDRFITNEEILDLFIERLHLSKNIRKSIVIFDGFTGFTPIQIKAIVEVIKSAKDVYITFPFENDLSISPYDNPNDNSLFSLTKKNIRNILEKCEGITVNPEVRLNTDYRHQNNSAISYLESTLFRAKKIEGKVSSKNALTIAKCADVDNECHVLCEKVLSDITDNGYRYRDVAIICADMTKYQKTLEKYLTEFNIPFYMDSNRNIENNALVKFILSAVDVLSHQFKSDDVIRFLRSGFAPFTKEEIDVLENYIYARGIRGTKKWKEPFAYLSEEMKRNEENLDEVNILRERFINLFLPIIEDGIKKRKLSVWIKQIYELTENAKVTDRLDELINKLSEEGKIAEEGEYKGVYDKVVELFDSLIDLMGDEEFTIKEFADILDVGFKEIRVGILPQKVDSLLVGDMQRTRLKEIKALYIVGVNDGNIPKAAASGGLLSLPEKEILKDNDCILAPTPFEQAFIEQLYIYLNLTKPTDKLYLSFATVGAKKNDKLIESYLIGVLREMYSDLEKSDFTKKRHELFLWDVKEETAKLLSKFVAGIISEDEEDILFKNIRKLKSSEKENEWCKKIIANAFREYKSTPLIKEVADSLYGEMISVSISTLEKFAKCPYSYFFEYGLELSDREEFGLNSIDMGNLGHNVLDQVGKELRDDKLDFSSVDEKELERRVDRAVELITSDYNGDLILNDEKSKYYVVQLARIMKRTVKTLGFQLSKGGFKIEDYELPFKKVYDIGDDDKIIFKGRIDRVDTYGSEEAGTEYVKITDYKSSSHDFSEDTMREGITLQLAMYMKNAIELLKERHSEKNVLPGAMLYYEIKDPFIESDKEFEENIRKELMPKGAIVNDQKVLEGLDKKLLEPSYISDVVRLETTKDAVLEKNKNAYSTEQFTNLLNEAEKKALSLSKEIIHGKIDINPFVDKNVDACQYCPLKGLCGFDTRIRGYAMRTAEKKNAE